MSIVNRVIEWVEKSAVDPARKGRTLVLLLVLGASSGILLALLLVNIAGHKADSRNPHMRVVEIDDNTQDPAKWGANYPIQFQDYLRTADSTHTKYGGSEAVPHTPSEADPRKWTAASRLQEDPRLVTMYSGYAFSRDFRKRRGHAYMLEDQLYTERLKVGQPGTCLNCHASTYVTYKQLGNGDIMAGFHKMNSMPYNDAKQSIQHPVSCIDCHTPETMALRITRPAFMEGIKALKASQGKPGYDVNRDASRQEMRTYVCAQCHVEYYFKGKEKTLTYPWANGLDAEKILEYYKQQGFTDWKHKETGAPVVKAQHPEFEMYSMGLHARSGVTCADCHMPYKREGAMKVSSHWIRSPLLDTRASCGTCHSIAAEDLEARVLHIQTRNAELRNLALDALMDLIAGIKQAKAAGKTDAQLAEAFEFQKQAQWFIDFVESENSMGFHAPQESARLFGKAIDACRKGMQKL